MFGPRVERRRYGAANLVVSHTALRLISYTVSHTSSDSESIAVSLLSAVSITPALLTSTSSPPVADATASNIASICVRSRRSQPTAIASPPAAPIRRAVSPAASWSRSATATLAAPWRVISSAIARPMPWPAPVTSAILPSSMAGLLRGRQQVLDAHELHPRAASRLAGLALALVDRTPAAPADRAGNALQDPIWIVRHRLPEAGGRRVFDDLAHRVGGVLLVRPDHPARAALDPADDVLASVRAGLLVADAATD